MFWARNVNLPNHKGHCSRKALVNYHQFYSRLKTALGLQVLNTRAQTHLRLKQLEFQNRDHNSWEVINTQNSAFGIQLKLPGWHQEG